MLEGPELAAQGVAGRGRALHQLELVALEQGGEGAGLGQVGRGQRGAVGRDDAGLEPQALAAQHAEALEVGRGERLGLLELDLAQSAELSQQG